MTKETKLTAEKVVENIKGFIVELHEVAIDGIKTNDTQEKAYVLACFAHDISHALYDIVKGKNPHDALEAIFTDGEKNEDDDASFAGVLSVKIENGEVKGIENITDPKIKEQLAKAVHKLSDELGSK